MRNNETAELIVRLENYLECWKQFNHYMNLARFKKFTIDDENQFLEVKSIVTQELELILASLESGPITREEVHTLIAGAPSIRYLSENNEAALRELENRWHKQLINLQSLLCQLKVKQRQEEQRLADLKQQQEQEQVRLKEIEQQRLVRQAEEAAERAETTRRAEEARRAGRTGSAS